jgi:hypothetical protein
MESKDERYSGEVLGMRVQYVLKKLERRWRGMRTVDGVSIRLESTTLGTFSKYEKR